METNKLWVSQIGMQGVRATGRELQEEREPLCIRSPAKAPINFGPLPMVINQTEKQGEKVPPFLGVFTQKNLERKSYAWVSIVSLFITQLRCLSAYEQIKHGIANQSNTSYH